MNQENFERKIKYINEKTNELIGDLSLKLNLIHKKQYSNNFWKKVLYVSINRYITINYDIYEKLESLNKTEDYILEIKKMKYNHNLPRNFDELRDIIQHQNLNDYIDFGIYKNILHDSYAKKNISEINFQSKIIKKISKLIIKIIRPLDLMEKLIKLAAINLYSKKIIKIGLMGVLFKPSNITKLILLTAGRVNEIKKINIYNEKIFDVNHEARKYLITNNGNDKFDNFLYQLLEIYFPTMYLERFLYIEKVIISDIEKYKNTEYIVSETWPSDDVTCLRIALMQELYNIKHIYNEHNYIEHPYVGSLIDETAKLSDIFISLGWDSGEIKNLIPGGSLFNFGRAVTNRKIEYKICYITGVALRTIPQYSSSYGFGGPFAENYIKMYKTFFDNLNDNLIKNIYYRAYPKERIIGWSFFEKEMLLADKIKRFKKFDSANTDSKKIMLKSELVIVDYISASYLEALVMNIPTVVLFDKNSYFLKKKYKDIFYDLERVGIFQPEPIAAAKFINMVSEDVNKWWLSESTQVARKIFLNANLKDGNNIFNILSECSKK